MRKPTASSRPSGVSRRETVLAPAALLSALGSASQAAPPAESQPPFNAMGERAGEVTDHSAIVHTRLTAAETRNDRGYSFPVWAHNLSQKDLQGIQIPAGMKLADLHGACPGKAGRVRIAYAANARLDSPQRTDWVAVDARTDFTHQFHLENLKSDTLYYYAVETAQPEGSRTRRGIAGRFRTAPAETAFRPMRFFVLTCQDYACRDHLGGYKTYASMTRLGGEFLVSTGDNVYYDLDPPFARSVDIARHHWHRMYSQPTVVDLFRNMSGYWLKDDHDSCEDDNWSTRPTQRVQPMDYATLSPVFREQVPMGKSTYRSVRWGKSVEIWFVENRDFRSPNPDPDGPNKTLWGKEQKEWVERTLLASKADFRVLISPNCIVGPDSTHGSTFKLPGGGADSHGDGGYGYEGREFRHWVRDNGLKNLVVINGDRHWQYHSVDPDTGLNEFSCGAVADSHSVKDAVHDPRYHKFLRMKGGFISVSLEGTADRPRLAIRHHDVEGKVVHEAAFGA